MKHDLLMCSLYTTENADVNMQYVFMPEFGGGIIINTGKTGKIGWSQFQKRGGQNYAGNPAIVLRIRPIVKEGLTIIFNGYSCTLNDKSNPLGQ